MNSKVAVIMSVYKYDTLSTLRDAMQSLYDQTLRPDIFLMLDGEVSPDIEAYLDNELNQNRIVFLGKREQNRGLAYSLNELLNAVLPLGYDYIARMDADDISIPLRIEKQVQFLETNTDVQAVGGWIEEFNTDTGKTQVIRYGETHDELRKNLVKRNPVAHVTVCFRRGFFDTIPRYDTTMLNEDLDLWIKAFTKGVRLHVLPEVLVKVRTSNAFFDRRRNVKRALEVMRLKIKATRTFGFGIMGYFYAIAHFLLFISPAWLKRYMYKHMRG